MPTRLRSETSLESIAAICERCQRCAPQQATMTGCNPDASAKSL